MNIKFIAATITFFLATTILLLSSELPPCDQTESPTTYDNCFGSLELKGDVYIGEWKNGVAHGNGEYISSNGDHYFGAYKNGQRNGQGVYKFPGGNVYIGFFENNVFQGLGQLNFVSGSWYIGNWNIGQMDGLGMHVFKGGAEHNDVYIGHYKNGKKNGKGLYVEANGNADICIYENEEFGNCYGETILDIGSELLMLFTLLSEEDKLKVQTNLSTTQLYRGEISGKWNIETFTALVGFAAVFLENFKFEYKDEAEQILIKVLNY